MMTAHADNVEKRSALSPRALAAYGMIKGITSRLCPLVISLPGLLACRTEADACLESHELWKKRADTSHVVCIRGDLIIENKQRSDLEVLASIETIEGSLRVQDNPALMEFSALPHLRVIEGSLVFAQNSALERVDEFPALASVAGEVYVVENSRLTHFSLADELSRVESAFFGSNPVLTTIEGTSGLATVTNDVLFLDNPALKSVDFTELGEVGGDMLLTGNAELDLLNFPVLSKVGGSLEISNTQVEIITTQALERARAIYIHDCEQLIEFSLTNRFSLGSIQVSDNPNLERIEADPNVHPGSTGAFYVTRNSSLVSISGFTNITLINDIFIADNPALKHFAAFNKLDEVTRNLHFSYNRSLEADDTWLSTLRAAKQVSIFGNSSLDPTIVGDLLSHVQHDEPARVGDNMNQDTALDPCPWPGDHICDAESSPTRPGTGLCLADLEDCDG